MNAPAQPSPLGVPAAWDAVAATYAKDVTPVFARYGEEAIRLASPLPGARILDVAAGPGTLTFLAARDASRVTAVDFSPKMIDELRTRAKLENVGNVDADVMDAQELRFPDATFDAAFCLFAFMFFPDRARAFRELYRVLRPGGKAVVATWAPMARRPFMKLGFDALVEAFPQMPAPSKADLQSPEECIAEMSAAGFRDVATTTFDSSLFVDSAEYYLQIMERSGACFGAIRKRIGEEAWPRAYASLLEGVRRRIPAEGIDLSSEALLTIGTH